MYLALESKFSVDIIDYWSFMYVSLFLRHCRQGYLNIVEFLLTNSKADATAKNIDGFTPLHLASM